MSSNELSREVQSWPALASEFVVVDQATLDDAGGLLKAIKALREKIAEAFDPIIRKAHEAHKAAVAEKKRHEAPLDEAERIIKGKISEYLEQERRRAEEEARRAQEEALRAAEELRLAEAEALEAEGRTAEAEAVLGAALPVPRVEVAVPQTDGVQMRYQYSVEVTDLSALARWALGVPGMAQQVLLPNTAGLNAMARAQKDAFAVPGCKLVRAPVIAARRG